MGAKRRTWLGVLPVAVACSSYQGNPPANGDPDLAADAAGTDAAGSTSDAQPPPAPASANRLLVDLNTRGQSSSPVALGRLPDGRLLFQADDGIHGRELFVSGGTADTTLRITDLVPGPADAPELSVAIVADGAYVSGVVEPTDEAPAQHVLWFTDGTEGGTKRVTSIDLELGGYSYALQSDGERTTPVAASGTTACLSTQQPGSLQSVTCFTRDGGELRTIEGVRSVLVHDGRFVFGTVLPGDGGELRRIVVTDGAAAEQPLATGHTLTAGVSLGARAVLLVQDSNANGQQLAALEGDTLDIVPYPAGATVDAYWLRGVGDRAFVVRYLDPANPSFVNRKGRLHVTDGTELGTRLIADPYPDEPGSMYYTAITKLGADYVFSGNAPTTGARALYRTTGVLPFGGAPVPGVGVAPLGSEPVNGRLCPVGTRVLFGCNQPASGSELWISDGVSDTRLLKDLFEYQNQSGLVSGPSLAGATALFSCQLADRAADVCFSDGVTTTSSPVNVTATGNFSGDVLLHGDTVFAVESRLGESTVFRVDATTGATATWTSAAPDSPVPGTSLAGLRRLPNGAAVTIATNADVTRRTLVRLDPTAAGLTAAAGPGEEAIYFAGETPEGVVIQRGNAAYTFWDGVSSTLAPLALVGGDVPAGNLNGVARLGERAFALYRDGSQLNAYRIDGATLVPLVRFGLPTGTVVMDLQVGNGSLFLLTDHGVYRSSGNTDDLVEVADAPVPTDLAGLSVTFLNWFDVGADLYRPVQVSSLAGVPDFAKSGVYALRDGAYVQVIAGYVSWLRSAGSTVIANVYDELGATHLRTAEGVLLTEAAPDPDFNEWPALGTHGASVYFLQDSPRYGLELWRTDGTPQSTRIVADIAPGARNSQPYLIGFRGPQAYVLADDYTHGREIQVVDPGP